MKNLIRRFMGWVSGPGAAPPVSRGPVPGVTSGSLVCLETGARKALLHRHIRQTLGMTPEQYREKWGLPPDYPMVSEAYARRRAAVRDKKKTA